MDIKDIKKGREYIFFSRHEGREIIGEVKKVIKDEVEFHKVKEKDGSPIPGWEADNMTLIPFSDVIKPTQGSE